MNTEQPRIIEVNFNNPNPFNNDILTLNKFAKQNLFSVSYTATFNYHFFANLFSGGIKYKSLEFIPVSVKSWGVKRILKE